MQDIGKFFNKFNNIAIKELKKRELICNVIFELTKQNIDIKDISIKNGTITIKGNQSFKNEIFIKKGSLISKISKSIGEKVFDIK